MPGTIRPRVAEFEAIGTYWQIDLYDAAEVQHTEVMSEIHERIAEFDRAYSRFRGDSLVAHMAKKAGAYELPTDAPAMMDLYRKFYDLTDGAMTPLAGQLLDDAGYNAEYRLTERPDGLRAVPEWDEVMSWDGQRLTLRQPALLDFGAVGKGYLVDLVGEIIEASGIDIYLVDAGGDMRHRNVYDRPARVGLEHPARPKEIIGVVELSGASLCGSAGNRRAWGNWHHIVNPIELAPAEGIAAVWAVAANTALADGLTTALYFAEAKTLKSTFDFEYAMVYSDGRLEHSPNFPAEFFIRED